MVGQLAYHPPSMGQPSGTIFTEPLLVVNQFLPDDLGHITSVCTMNQAEPERAVGR